MAHPMKREAIDGHNAKMRRMTDGYGLGSGPANNILAPSERSKGGSGPEPAVGFGADSTVLRSRADRASRKQMVSNPVATLKRGGHVKRARGGKVHHRDSGGTTTADSPIEEANLNQSAASNRARGGRSKHKGSTHVNVIVAPQGGGGATPMRPPVIPPGGPMVPPAAGAAPPVPPPGAPPGMPPGMAGARPMPMAAPGSVPPGLVPPRKRGGKVEHPDEAQDKKLIQKTLREEGLVRSNKAEKMPIEGRAMGGHVEGVTGPKGKLPNQKHNMEAGAISGIGRLEKIGEKPKTAGKPQAV